MFLFKKTKFFILYSKFEPTTLDFAQKRACKMFLFQTTGSNNTEVMNEFRFRVFELSKTKVNNGKKHIVSLLDSLDKRPKMRYQIYALL